MDSQQLWDSALIEIELSISRANFKTWFKDTFVSKQEDGVVYVSVPSEFVKGWLQDKFHKLILKTLRLTSDKVRSVEYIVSKERPVSQKIGGTLGALGKIELPLDNFYVNKKDNLNLRYDFDSFVVGPFNELAHAAYLSLKRFVRNIRINNKHQLVITHLVLFYRHCFLFLGCHSLPL